MFDTKYMNLIAEGCVFIRKTVVSKVSRLVVCVVYIMYTWNRVTLDKTRVYLFVSKSGVCKRQVLNVCFIETSLV